MTDKPTKVDNEADLPTLDEAFHLTNLYPDASALFSHDHARLEDIKDECLVVLDGNVLLFPYEYNSASITALSELYARLAKEKRLVVPAHAAREFNKHRSRKVSRITEKIEGKIDLLRAIPTIDKIPLLEENETYKEAINLANEIKKMRSKLVKTLTTVSGTLKDDIVADRVSNLYRKILPDTVKDIPCSTKKEREAILEDAQRRTKHKIPPGFKDSSKDDGGIGDYLIWRTALQEGAARKKHCIFVTNEEKNDWWVKSLGTFQPRPELIEEYRRETGGCSVHLMPLSDLLELFDAKPDTVENAKSAEQSNRTQGETVQLGSEFFSNVPTINLAKIKLSKVGKNLVQRHLNHESLQKEVAELRGRLHFVNHEIECIEGLIDGEDDGSLDSGIYQEYDTFVRERLMLNSNIEKLLVQIRINTLE